jgi:hypothetical protein
MRTRMAVPLVVLASALSVSCSSNDVLRPIAPSSTASFARPKPQDPCDPKKEECTLLGRFTGGGGQEVAVGDVYVTRGFTLHCDVVLSNNLEINWPGNKWHTDKPFPVVQCLDDPAITPNPPSAPVDTYIGEGLGSLNGVPGATAYIVLKDSGEQGGKNDFAQIRITDANGVVVLEVPLSALTNGNIQAHYDQPHK